MLSYYKLIHAKLLIAFTFCNVKKPTMMMNGNILRK